MHKGLNMLRRSVVVLSILFVWPQIDGAAPRIDRKALVTRHNPILHKLDVDAPLTVGNGGFAFGADITGLQTFAEHYHRWGIPVETLSRWAWHSQPNPNNYKLDDTNQDYRLPDGRILGFPTRQASPAGDWLRKNPHNHPLGQLALEWLKADGSAIRAGRYSGSRANTGPMAWRDCQPIQVGGDSRVGDNGMRS